MTAPEDPTRPVHGEPTDQTQPVREDVPSVEAPPIDEKPPIDAILAMVEGHPTVEDRPDAEDQPVAALPPVMGPASPAEPRRSPRMRTVAFGFVLALVAFSVIAARASGAHLDGGSLVVIGLVGAGILMVVGALTAPVRHRR